MRERISATEAARSFSELLNRLRYKGDAFVIVRNGEEVGRLEPVSSSRPKTLGELFEMIEQLGSPDGDFAPDLEEIREAQPPLPESSWGS